MFHPARHKQTVVEHGAEFGRDSQATLVIEGMLVFPDKELHVSSTWCS
jgi:hypothetical protein